MSRKPTIKISYPEASEKALQLTEAMVKRAPGKRVVETESDDPVFPGAGDLFSSFIRCKTQTGVELTLNLNPSSMDYALETLIRPNLTADERKRILGDSASGDDLLPGSAPAEEQTAPDQEKQIDVGKIPDRDLRTILADLVDAAQGYVQGGQDAWEKHIENAIETAIKEVTERLYNEDRINPAADPSWDDVEAEARSMGKKQDQDIEPGLLNDLDDGSDGMAPAEEGGEE